MSVGVINADEIQIFAVAFIPGFINHNFVRRIIFFTCAGEFDFKHGVMVSKLFDFLKS